MKRNRERERKRNRERETKSNREKAQAKKVQTNQGTSTVDAN